MDDRVHAILDSLPPPRARSKLEPYAELIRALRARGLSYRDIVTILRERCSLQVGTHTVYNFVRVRTRAHRARAHRSPRRGSLAAQPRTVPAQVVETPTALETHLAAVKTRPIASAPPAPKEFAFNEHEPLRLISPSKKS